jgi:hypothetical protein
MARGDSKIDVGVIVKAQRATYVDDEGNRRLADRALLEWTPIGVAVACLIFGVELPQLAAGGLLTVSFLLSALFFGLMLQISDRAMSWADSTPQPSKDTSRHAELLLELAAHAGYAALVSILAAIAYVVASVGSGPVLVGSSAVGIALGVHLVLVLLMVLKRVFLITKGQLNQAQTNHPTADDRP